VKPHARERLDHALQLQQGEAGRQQPRRPPAGISACRAARPRAVATIRRWSNGHRAPRQRRRRPFPFRGGRPQCDRRAPPRFTARPRAPSRPRRAVRSARAPARRPSRPRPARRRCRHGRGAPSPRPRDPPREPPRSVPAAAVRSVAAALDPASPARSRSPRRSPAAGPARQSSQGKKP